ncbi:MAG: hypothetical protein C0602_03805 [Denitrovibrio sp.]|nr:MAG: hypothetical protein C0602_03805 [Denitrovibrio sp.]
MRHLNIHKLSRIILLTIVVTFISVTANSADNQNIPLWAKPYFDKSKESPEKDSPEQKKAKKIYKFRKIFKDKDPKEEVLLILELDSEFIPEGFLDSTAKSSQRARIKAVQDKVHKKLKDKHSYYKNKKIGKFDTVPYLTMKATRDDMQDLLDIDEITNVQVDELAKPIMSESNVLIGSDTAWANGFTGSGQTVAVLDTGVEKTHAFLSGKVVAEACFSNAGGAGSGVSLCPGGVTTSYASGSGVNCSSAVDGCDHGTHVAGTIAGENGTGGISGVAPDATIIAMNVFTNFSGEALSYTTDQTRALERVYALRGTYDIASVNMSLGGGSYSSYCDNDSRKAIIDNLRSAGIATVIASGNNGYTNSISGPACISTAIAVGSVQDGSYGTTADRVSSFSNSSSLVDMLAPGQYITSSVPGGGYSAWAGTSMATPHVAGAWALVMSADTTATVSEVESALETTGTSVTDTKNNVTKPRINVDEAIDTFGTGSVKVTILPAGAIADGAQWKVNGGVYQNSAATVAELSLGDHSIAFKSLTHSNNAKVWMAPSSLTATVSSNGQLVSLTGTYTESDKILGSRADFDADGKADILLNNTETGQLHIYMMDGLTRVSNDYVKRADGSVINLAAGWGVSGLADFDNDKKSDILLTNYSTGQLHIYMMDGLTRLSNDYVKRADGSVISLANGWVVAGVGDLDGDGKADILLANYSTGQLHIYMMDGLTRLSNDYVKRADGSVISLASGWVVAGVADLDGDGKADILLANYSTGQLHIYMMDGLTRLSNDYVKRADGSVINLSSSWEIAGVSDFDKDGKADILLANYTLGRLHIYMMDGLTRLSNDYVKRSDGSIISLGSAWRVSYVTDYNGDGKSDILLSNPETGQVHMYMMDGLTRVDNDYVKRDDGSVISLTSSWSPVDK